MQKRQDNKSRKKYRANWKKERETGEWIKDVRSELTVHQENIILKALMLQYLLLSNCEKLRAYIALV